VDKNEVLIPHKYNVYMQDLETEHLELKLLGFVRTIGEARTMVSAFRESFAREGKNATVFFQHE
jgi:hypothetical protein